jgi:uncharacterized membrane protein YgcG
LEESGEEEKEWFIVLMDVCELLLVFMWEERPKRGPSESDVQTLLMSVLNVAGTQFGFKVRAANGINLLVRQGFLFKNDISGCSDLFLDWFIRTATGTCTGTGPTLATTKKVLAAVIEVKVKFSEWRYFPQTVAEVFGAIASASEEWHLPANFSEASIPRGLLFNGTMLARVRVNSPEQVKCDMRPLPACRPLWEFLSELQKEATCPRSEMSLSSPFSNSGGGTGGREDGGSEAGGSSGGGHAGGGHGGFEGKDNGKAEREGGGDPGCRDGVAKKIHFSRAPLQQIDSNSRNVYLDAANMDRWNHGQPLVDYLA